jgi:HK97 family phage prohead protease
MGRFVEKFATRSMYPSDRGVVALYQHDTKQVLGKTGNKSLVLDFREDGVYFELDLPNTTLGRDVAELVKRQDVAGVSPGFNVEDDNWLNKEKEDYVERTILKSCLFEISLTPYPAYPDTEVTLREASYVDYIDRHKVKPVSFPLPTDEQLSKLQSLRSK